MVCRNEDVQTLINTLNQLSSIYYLEFVLRNEEAMNKDYFELSYRQLQESLDRGQVNQTIFDTSVRSLTTEFNQTMQSIKARKEKVYRLSSILENLAFYHNEAANTLSAKVSDEGIQSFCANYDKNRRIASVETSQIAGNLKATDKSSQIADIQVFPNKSHPLMEELTPEEKQALFSILDLIAWAEGTDQEIGNTKKGYNIIFTFATFSDFSKHPRITKCSGRLCSTAAGRYQFLDKTWDSLQRNLKNAGFQPFPSFGPEYQDQAALYLIDWKRGVLDEVDRGNFQGFLQEGAKEWASLPYPPTGKSFYGQPTAWIPPNQAVSKAEATYKKILDLWEA